MLIFLTACGQASRNPSSENQLGAALTVGGTFSDSEKNIAIRTCYAFRSKNANFRARFISEDFRFLVTERTCQGVDRSETLTTELKAPLATGPMVFDAVSTIDYFSQVQTDQHGHLSSICNSLLQGGDPQKSILLGNTVIELTFYTSDLDHFIVRTANKEGNNYIVAVEERFKFDTNNAAGDNVGKVVLATKEQTCGNGSISTISQQAL